MTRGEKHVTKIDGFRWPDDSRIDRTRASERLYKREHERTKAIEAAARELAAFRKHDRKDFWTVTMVEELHTILDTYEKGAALVAAEAYLTRAGYTITRPDGSGSPRME